MLRFFGPKELSLGTSGPSDTSELPQRRELFPTSGLAESIEPGVPIRQKVRWSVKLDDFPVLEEHNSVIIDHSSQPVRDRQDRTFGEPAKGFW
jgi:hypothetical protein